MSQENVKLVRSAYDAFARRDSDMPFVLYAHDIEWDVTRTHVVGANAVYRGHDGVRAMFRAVMAELRDFEFQPRDITPYGDDVLVTVAEHGVGRRSGAAVDRRHFALWTLRDGMVIRVRTYLDRGEALRAAGLAG